MSLCPAFLPVLGPNLESSEYSKKDHWTNKLMVQKEGEGKRQWEGEEEEDGKTEEGRRWEEE